MKRFSAYDPPEYQDWSPDPEAQREFVDCVRRTPDRRAVIEALDADGLLGLYRGLVRNRLHDIALKRWVRQGVISKAWLGTGEEASTVGAVHALVDGDVVGPMIRNAGACHEMGMPLVEIFRAYLGTSDSPTGGRDLHFGDLSRGVVAPISMVGALVPVCAGIALGFKLRGTPNVALTWVGDGSTRTTAFHEGMACAVSMSAPLIVVVQDNAIALGTPTDAHSGRDMEKTASIYGAHGLVCDGNNVLDVYAATRLAAERARRGDGPVVITAKTFRMGGHATHDEGESRRILPDEAFQHWGRRDPIGMYETYLAESDVPLSAGETNASVLERAAAEVEAEIDAAQSAARENADDVVPDPATQQDDVFAVAE